MLRRGAGIGTGYEMRVDLEAGANLSICPVREDGGVDDQHPLVLQGNDQAVMLSLWQSVVQSAVDLMNLRQRMVSAAFNGRSLLELTSPRINTMGATDDLRRQILAIESRRRNAALYGVGVSAGSGLIVRYLGEEGARSRLRDRNRPAASSGSAMP